VGFIAPSLDPKVAGSVGDTVGVLPSTVVMAKQDISTALEPSRERLLREEKRSRKRGRGKGVQGLEEKASVEEKARKRGRESLLMTRPFLTQMGPSV
jgi:hypothetical protein